MMMNLFSTFDPSSSFNINMNWISSTIIIFFSINKMWNNNSRFNLITFNIQNTLNNEFKTHLTTSKASMILITILLFIMMNNLMGLIPYIFTSTSHMLLTITMALPLWTSFMLSGWLNKTSHMFTHLVPMGTPSYLMPFMVLIETISNIIRPLTLSIRLAANMIAGHLLLTLLGNMGPLISLYMLIPMLTLQMLLLILETAVAIIQSYVFTILITLYLSEIN